MNHDKDHIDDPNIPHHNEMKSGDEFKLPPMYFDTLADRIMERVEKNVLPDELKSSPFSTPGGYFENFADRLMHRIHAPKAVKKISTKFSSLRRFSVAASVVLILSLCVIYLFKNQKPVDYFADITEDELLEYVSVHARDFDRFSLAYVMNEDDIKAIDIFDDMDDETSDLLIELYQ